MRNLVFSLLLMFVPCPGMSFEIEAKRRFTAENESVMLTILSTTDLDLFSEVITQFQEKNKTISIDYFEVSSSELFKALNDDTTFFDLALSSAMDLQTKIANDGLALAYSSEFTKRLPAWAHWQNYVFAFTQEPASIVLSAKDFADLTIPSSRQELIATIRAYPERFSGRIGTYDVRTSGLGYLFATQDARTSETYWRLAEVMGITGTKLYCCSGKMIDDVISGDLAVAYNVLGSYAKVQARPQDDIIVLNPKDYTTLMLRSALISTKSQSPQIAGKFIDHLISFSLDTDLSKQFPFPALELDALQQETSLRPIRLGPGLLVYLDRLKRQNFIKAWENATLQTPQD